MQKISLLFAPDAVYEDLAIGFRAQGSEAIKEFIKVTVVGMPDFHVQVTNMFARGNWIASEWIMSGTHTGDWPDLPATGKNISVRGASITQVELGRITRHSDYYDEQELLRQLGVAEGSD